MTRPSRLAGPAPSVVLIGPGPGTRGGIAQFNSHLADSLAAAGARVSILGFARLYPRWTRAGRQGGDTTARGTRTSSTAADVLVPWAPWTWLRGARALRRAAPDLVVVQWWHPMFAFCYAALAVVARRGGARVVFVCHNAEPHERFPLSQVLTRLALVRADVLFVLSSGVGEALSNLLPGATVKCVPHPAYTSLASIDATAEAAWQRRIDAGDRKIVLFFGNVRPYKGLDDLLVAFAVVRSEVPSLLVVAGTFFESVETYRARIDELDLAGDVLLFPGYVPDEEVAALFELADLVVLPYRSGSQTGIGPLAAHLGKPVVATDVGGIADALGPDARLAPPGRPPELAVAIVESLRAPAPAQPPTATWDEWARALLEVTSVAR